MVLQTPLILLRTRTSANGTLKSKTAQYGDAVDTDTHFPRFTKLEINTVRVYTIDNSKNHDACMTALAAAGIYLALDVNTPKYSINQKSPAKSYNAPYLQSLFATIDEFAKYSNTLLFFSGNEVINDVPTSKSAPYVKAVTRDMKQYIKNRNYRAIPVGYSAADIDDNRVEAAHFFNCGTDDERSDFFAFNDYSWCNPSSFSKSTWGDKVKAFSNYSIPIFLSEYGCVKTARSFAEVATLYGSQMTPVYSGGLVYEYSQEGTAPPQSKYGLVKVSSDSTTELDDFDSLKTAFKKTPIPTDDGGYKPDGGPSNCPDKSSTWLVSGDGLPAIPAAAKKYSKSGAGSGPGLSGDGSQDAGAGSTGTATAGSGQASSTGKSKSTHSSVASGHMGELSLGPLVCGLVVSLSSLLGAFLL